MVNKNYEDGQMVFILNDEFHVTQDNKLITSKYDMTVMEQKMFLIMMSTIKKDTKEIPSTIFRVSDLAVLLDVGVDVLYRDLPKLCKKIISRTIEIKLDNGDWEMFNIISYAKYHNGKGAIQLDINKKAEPYLLELKELFLSYQLKNVLFLNSKYSIRIFQLAKSNIYRKTFTIKVDELKDMLKLTQKSYSLYSNIKLKVLDPSIKEINEKTDIKVQYSEVKVGRKVDSIKFTVSNSSIAISKKNDEKKLKFNNFEGRNYDYDYIEEVALCHAEYDESKLYK